MIRFTLAVPNFILPNFGNFYSKSSGIKYKKLRKVKAVGVQKIVYGGPVIQLSGGH